MNKVRICAIGNSHLGSFKRGWGSIAATFPNVQVSFYSFFGPGGGTDFFKGFNSSLDGKHLFLEPSDLSTKYRNFSGKTGTIPIENVDIFLICGGIRNWFNPCKRTYSKQVQVQHFNSFIEQSNGFILLEKIRQVSSKKVFLTHMPFWNKMGFDFGATTFSYLDEVSLMNTSLLSNKNSELLPQAPETYGLRRTTKKKYCYGDRPRHVETETGFQIIQEFDRFHANSAFGALSWINLFDKIGI